MLYYTCKQLSQCVKNNLKNYIFVAFPRITITTKGKNSAIEAKAIPDLVKLLNDPESEVRLNALKVSKLSSNFTQLTLK